MTTDEKLIKNKLGLLQLAAYLKSVSEACRVMGCRRDTFYRIKKAHEEGGIEALRETSRRRPNLRNRVAEDIEQAVVALCLRDSLLRPEARQRHPAPARGGHLGGRNTLRGAASWAGDLPEALKGTGRACSS